MELSRTCIGRGLAATLWMLLTHSIAVAQAPHPSVDAETSSVATVGLEEITVTAQRRSERMQDVGISVAALSADELKSSGITVSTDIAKFTPGMTTSGTLGGQGLQFSIRGVTQADYNDAIEAPVAVYIDDTYVASQQAQGMALFDMARAEALKGPQGTLFGRNATGGLVQFIVNTPTLSKTEGYIDATYARFDKTIVEGALNIPIGDAFAVRVSGIWDRNGSVWKNQYPAGMVAGAPLQFGPTGLASAGQSVGNQDDIGARIQFLWQAGSDTTIRLTGSVFRQNLSESPWTSAAIVPVVDSQGRIVNDIYASATETRAVIGPGGVNYFNPSTLPFEGFLFSPNKDGHRAPGADWFGYVPLNPSSLQLSKDFAQSDLNRFRAYNGALHINSTLSGADLASVTSFSEYEKHFLLDADGSPVDGFAFGTKSNTHTFTQEFRLSGSRDHFSWVTGAFYLDINAPVAQGLLAPTGSALAAVFGLTATGVDPVAVFTLKTRSTSLFGQTSWEFAPQWSLVTGARLIREQQHYHYDSYAAANISDYSVDTSTVLFPLYPSFTDSRANWLWAGKAQLEYRPDRDVLIYGGINRGVKAGSYNGKLFDGSPPLDPSAIPYKPEVLVSVEGGFKLSDPGHNYTLNGAVYHYNYSDYQSFVFTDLSGSVQNKKAITNGAELEGNLQVNRAFRIGTGIAYNDATVKDLAIAPGVVRDTRPTYAPKFSGNLHGNFRPGVAAIGGDLDLGAILTYQSSFYHNARNFDGDLIAGRTLLDLTAELLYSNGFSVGAYLKNATDKRYKVVGLDLSTACGCNLEAYGQPRTAGLIVGYKF